jgi:predicted flap endonuclease-1-like 5' DNA nuclease
VQDQHNEDVANSDGAVEDAQNELEAEARDVEMEDFVQRQGARNPVPDQPMDAAFPPPVFEPERDDEAGPANPNQPPRRNANNTREVGAKKAKSLARRNQQRAYNEFVREQGEAQRAEWARDAKEREEKLEEGRSKRAENERRIKENEQKEREIRKLRAEEERREELDAIRDAGEIVREGLEVDGFVRCEDLARRVHRDTAWVQNLVRREGVLGLKNVEGKREVVLLTARGFIVRVTEDIMRMAYQRAVLKGAKNSGRVSWEDLGSVIQKLVTERT